MTPLPIRLSPGSDLRRALHAALSPDRAGFVVAGIGSLSVARLRFAGKKQPAELVGDLEILTLSGSLSPDGPHLHMSVSDADGRVFGGHVADGCVVRTTAEVLLVRLPGWAFARGVDAATGYAELVVSVL